ncbi:uncharacterized protein V1516DRAFT_55944 [Lipomyces oligophaga]|uniref:uncharacterized protein n=1 Tax=Lipomyces oligophaga TaxID=45792 RepID=UPI0034CFDC08
MAEIFVTLMEEAELAEQSENESLVNSDSLDQNSMEALIPPNPSPERPISASIQANLLLDSQTSPNRTPGEPVAANDSVTSRYSEYLKIAGESKLLRDQLERIALSSNDLNDLKEDTSIRSPEILDTVPEEDLFEAKDVDELDSELPDYEDCASQQVGHDHNLGSAIYHSPNALQESDIGLAVSDFNPAFDTDGFEVSDFSPPIEYQYSNPDGKSEIREYPELPRLICNTLPEFDEEEVMLPESIESGQTACLTSISMACEPSTSPTEEQIKEEPARVESANTLLQLSETGVSEEAPSDFQEDSIEIIIDNFPDVSPETPMKDYLLDPYPVHNFAGNIGTQHNSAFSRKVSLSTTQSSENSRTSNSDRPDLASSPAGFVYRTVSGRRAMDELSMNLSKSANSRGSTERLKLAKGRESDLLEFQTQIQDTRAMDEAVITTSTVRQRSLTFPHDMGVFGMRHRNVQIQKGQGFKQSYERSGQNRRYPLRHKIARTETKSDYNVSDSDSDLTAEYAVERTNLDDIVSLLWEVIDSWKFKTTNTCKKFLLFLKLSAGGIDVWEWAQENFDVVIGIACAIVIVGIVFVSTCSWIDSDGRDVMSLRTRIYECAADTGAYQPTLECVSGVRFPSLFPLAGVTVDHPYLHLWILSDLYMISLLIGFVGLPIGITAVFGFLMGVSCGAYLSLLVSERMLRWLLRITVQQVVNASNEGRKIGDLISGSDDELQSLGVADLVQDDKSGRTLKRVRDEVQT